MAGVCDVCDFRALDNAPNVDDLLFESDQGVLTSPEVFHYVLAIQWLETARKKLENKFLDAYFASGALSASVSFDPYFLEDSRDEEEYTKATAHPAPPSTEPQSRKCKAPRQRRVQNTRCVPYNTRRAPASAFDLENFLAMAQGLVKTGWPSTESFLKAKLAGMSQETQDEILEIVRTSGHTDFSREQKYFSKEATRAEILLVLQSQN